MIKPEELRIGNFVTTNNPEKIFITCKDEEERVDVDVVKSIFSDGYVELFNDGNFNSASYFSKFSTKDISPILLTEEWLLKFDIKPLDLNKDNVDIYKNPVGYYKKGTYEYVIEKEYDDCGLAIYITKEVEFVHRLQNIHFIIRDEELTIKD